MDDLVIHATTLNTVNSLDKKNIHALLLTGPGGIGKKSLARQIAASMLGINPKDLEKYTYYTEISPEDNQSVTIEEIRKLRALTTLKVPGTNPIRRVITVNDASSMTIESQNAFLKLLEESPSDTLVILGSQDINSLLPTIVSRTQVINLKKPPAEDLIKYFTSQGHNDSAISAAYNFSGGLPGLMSDILNNVGENDAIKSINLAKQIISSPVYERLVLLDQLSKEVTIESLIFALERIIKSALDAAANKQNAQAIPRLYNSLKYIASASEKLKHNPNKKLLLTDLVLHI